MEVDEPSTPSANDGEVQMTDGEGSKYYWFHNSKNSCLRTTRVKSLLRNTAIFVTVYQLYLTFLDDDKVT